MARLVLPEEATPTGGKKNDMPYANAIIDDHDQNIFVGLDSLCAEDAVLPSDWSQSAADDESFDVTTLGGDVLNARLDIEVECWGRRLA